MKSMQKKWAERDDLNRVEHIKQQKDGLDTADEIAKGIARPFDEIKYEDVERMKWAGLLHQRPRDGHFIIHIRIASGELTADQAEAVADIAEKYGGRDITITTRQALQIHDVDYDRIPEALQELNKAGLMSIEADGDSIRNITGNPLMGVDPEELFDTTGVVRELESAFVGNPEFSDLPRKFKISVSANPHDCGFARTNDIGFLPAIYDDGGNEIKGFKAYLGGGVSGQMPMLAQQTPFFLRPDDVVCFTRAVVEIFRDNGYRGMRSRTRFKYLVQETGIEELCRMIEEKAGSFLKGGRDITAEWNYGVFYGIHEQKQPGYFYAGFHVPCSLISPSELRMIAAVSVKYGSGRLRTTNAQNMLILDIPDDRIDEFEREKIFGSLPLNPGMFQGYASACSGNEFCNFAVMETRRRLAHITGQMEEIFPEIDHPFRITLSGCGACCALPQAADLGLQCTRGILDGKVTEAFFIYAGGTLGSDAHLGIMLDGKVTEENLMPALCDMIRYYWNHRNAGERFCDMISRVGIEAFQDIVNDYCIHEKNR